MCQWTDTEQGGESSSQHPTEMSGKAQLTFPYLIPEETKDTIPQVTLLKAVSFKSEHIFRDLYFLQPGEPRSQEIFSSNLRDFLVQDWTFISMSIKKILLQNSIQHNCYITKVLYLFILFSCFSGRFLQAKNTDSVHKSARGGRRS